MAATRTRPATRKQINTIYQITNIFENGDLTSGFAAITDNHDGCGYTAGFIGFCTATGRARQQRAHLRPATAARGTTGGASRPVLGCPVTTAGMPGIAEPMLIVRFPAGGNLSIEFTNDAPDSDQPGLGAWLELRADEPAALMERAVSAGLKEVKHPGHPYYFMAPGGQVFTIARTG